MSYTIKNRWNDKALYVAKGAADVRAALEEAVEADAYLGGAYLRDAYLGGAYLGGANLRDAYLGGAYLGGANLRDAYLGGANLRDANLRGAKGLAPERHNDLLILRDQVGKIRAYKLVSADYRSPIQSNGKLKYEIGKTVEVKKANTDPYMACAAGVNLATLPWCLSWHQPGQRILVCEFKPADIACIPDATDGKFRVTKCKVIREIPETQIQEWLGHEKETA